MSKQETICIYTNESINVAIAQGLRRRGVKAISAKDVGNLGLTDKAQLKFAYDEVYWNTCPTDHGFTKTNFLIYTNSRSYFHGIPPSKTSCLPKQSKRYIFAVISNLIPFLLP